MLWRLLSPHAGFLLGLFFNPENEGDTFLQKVVFQQTTSHIPEDRSLYNLLIHQWQQDSAMFDLLYK
jgi:hypothetical protein